ncbi:hypothetical protein DSO57_1015683 [Entomophthora muscae]|uniref:Uncharacterized protein n=1 Tax=Entomophthora muscae TaxID=34485 RepID=A0ACC2RJS7_9FUNG|nr:hypothetical protein DSO57_1015683 [Entomophthora muscae]
MAPPLNLRPNHLQENVVTIDATSIQLFGLAPKLWWALPSCPVVPPLASNSAPTKTWYPKKFVVNNHWEQFNAIISGFTLCSL